MSLSQCTCTYITNLPAPSLCIGDKSTCSSSPAACTDVRAPKVHKCQSHRGPFRATLTDPVLRLTSGSTLLPRHFVGANSDFPCGLPDWKRKLKVGREDSSFGRCACCLPPDIWGIHFVTIIQSDQFIIALWQSPSKMRTICFVETHRKRQCSTKDCVTRQDQPGKKKTKGIFSPVLWRSWGRKNQ